MSATWERVELARHPHRPYALDYLRRFASDFMELHGDRLSGDDPALVAGLGTWHGAAVMFFGQQKGRTLRDRTARNFGMMHPEGYRKAIRLAKVAARFRLPIVSLVDTPGAFPGASAEERGVATAIAEAIAEWFHVATPVVAAVIGEGGSGGALGMAIADRVLMLENSIFSVAGPEACASIVWRDAARRIEAAERLRLTSDWLLRLGIVDEVVPEPRDGAHTDHDAAARELDEALWRSLEPLMVEDPGRLLARRYARFRAVAAGDGD
jgi:acetyl-CoA carboxylase carboxyl transferase subunit alpha